MAGKDASKQFWKYHNEGILKKYQPKLQVGSLDTKPKPEPKPAAAPSPPTPVASTASAPAEEQEPAEPLEPFGSQIWVADPNWVSILQPMATKCND